MTEGIKQVCLGIDLGTTNSCIAVLTSAPFNIGTNPDVIANTDGDRTTPSVVAFEDAQVLVGKNAKSSISTTPEHTFYCVKRFIGRKSKDSRIKADKKNLTYPVYKDEKRPEKIVLKVATKRYNSGFKDEKPLPIYIEPEQISALVLTSLKEIANAGSKNPVNKVVVTVPANFNEYQKRATKDAALIAGLEPVDVISEPTAACITYACAKGKDDKEKYVLVYDFGGGTLDVSLVKIQGGNFTVIATAGNSHCGGSDIDQYLLEKMIEKHKKETGVDLSKRDFDEKDEYSKARGILLMQCEQAKIALSATNSYDLNCPNIYSKDGVPVDIKEKINQAVISDYIDKNKDMLLNPIKDVLEFAKIDKTKITDLVLVGGSCKIPAIHDIIKEEIGIAPYMPLNADEAIATGAAIYGAYCLKKQYPKEYNDVKIKNFDNLNITDVTPMNISLGLKNNKLDLQISRNSKIPSEGKWNRYKKDIIADEENIVSLPVYEGDSDKQNECYEVGKFNIKCTKTSGTEIIYARVIVNKSGITIHAAQSETEPKGTDYREAKFNTDQAIHTKDEITNLKNKNIEFRKTDVIIDEIVYHQVLVRLISRFSTIKNKLSTDATARTEIKVFLDNKRKKINEKYNDSNKMSKEEFIKQLNEIEKEIKNIAGKYKRPDGIQLFLNSELGPK